MATNNESRAPFPPFTLETATQKVRMDEDGWNNRNPDKVAMAYTVDSQWRNRAEFPVGRNQIIEFLTRRWAKEHEYRLIKELWAAKYKWTIYFQAVITFIISNLYKAK
jgi:uncharacterized protein